MEPITLGGAVAGQQTSTPAIKATEVAVGNLVPVIRLHRHLRDCERFDVASRSHLWCFVCCDKNTYNRCIAINRSLEWMR
jgi:hypothetical protein